MPLVDEEVKTQKIFKVSEITREIRKLIESKYPVVWIEGEVSNCKHHSSGHIYFTLKDEMAQISAVFFARENQNLKFELKDGLKVICLGRISIYDARGQYQVYVQRMEPKGLGSLQLAFLQLKEKLEKEGLFKSERKRPIPLYPRRIGIITSPTGAALQDMLKIFKKRTFGLHIILAPVRVQGDGAGLEISSALDELNTRGGIDLIIAGRGGGSLEDLWAFNEEVVARAMMRSAIPVISAVGHEVDWTIADFVSDYRAHTPTAAAELVVSKWDELDWKLREVKERMKSQFRLVIASKREAFTRLRKNYVFREPQMFVDRLRQELDESARELQMHIKHALELKTQFFRTVTSQLEALSPLASLGRGYSLTFSETGKLIKRADEIKVGEVVQTKLSSGFFHSKVTEVKRD